MAVTNISDNTPFASSGNCELDSDGGVFMNTSGVVIHRKSYWSGRSAVGDACSSPATFVDSEGKQFKAYSKITERYCHNGSLREVVFDSSNLGEGYCVVEKVKIPNREETINSAKWVSLAKICVPDGENSVKDQNGKVYKNRCGSGKDDKNVFYNYSCVNGSVRETIHNCSLLDPQGRCSISGCYGNFTDNDPNDDKDIAGVLVVDGVPYLDKCSPKGTHVSQYKIVNGRAVLIKYDDDNPWLFCGVNRECVINSTSGAGYCRNKYAGTDTMETLKEKIEGLAALVESLEKRVGLLEDKRNRILE